MKSAAFQQGMEAQQLGQPKEYNRYQKGTIQHTQWNEGWDYSKKQVEDERE